MRFPFVFTTVLTVQPQNKRLTMGLKAAILNQGYLSRWKSLLEKGKYDHFRPVGRRSTICTTRKMYVDI